MFRKRVFRGKIQKECIFASFWERWVGPWVLKRNKNKGKCVKRRISFPSSAQLLCQTSFEHWFSEIVTNTVTRVAQKRVKGGLISGKGTNLFQFFSHQLDFLFCPYWLAILFPIILHPLSLWSSDHKILRSLNTYIFRPVSSQCRFPKFYWGSNKSSFFNRKYSDAQYEGKRRRPKNRWG